MCASGSNASVAPLPLVCANARAAARAPSYWSSAERRPAGRKLIAQRPAAAANIATIATAIVISISVNPRSSSGMRGQVPAAPA